jgi:hypothetical protein
MKPEKRNLQREEAEALLDVTADKIARYIFSSETSETLESLFEQRDKAWRAYIASQPTDDHLIELISRQNAMESSLDLGRLKFIELEQRIKAWNPPNNSAPFGLTKTAGGTT